MTMVGVAWVLTGGVQTFQMTISPSTTAMLSPMRRGLRGPT
jgi:hypothetical protein